MTTKRPNSAYIILRIKTYELLKKLAAHFDEPMTFVVQRALELLDKEVNK